MKVNKSIRAKLYKYFKDRLGLKPSTKGFLRGDCPHCGGKFTFGVNLESMRTKCFKNCGVPSPLNLVMEVEELETWADLRGFLNVQQEYEAYDSVIQGANKPVKLKPVELPESFTPINLGSGLIANAARRALSKRGFDITELALHGIGYCIRGDYMGYLIFPFYEKGKLVFFQGRRFASAGPKMKNPKEEDFGIGKSQLIYNKDALFIYDKIYVVESITNALTIGERAIALLGKTASSYQISCLIQSPCRRVVLMLDPDAVEEALRLAMILSQYKEVKLVMWDDPDKDVNDYGKRYVIKREKLFTYNKYQEFFKLAQKIKYDDQGTINTYNRNTIKPVNVRSYLR